jgi:MFS family permease
MKRSQRTSPLSLGRRCGDGALMWISKCRSITLCCALWSAAAGESEFALRLLSAFAILLTAAAAINIGKRLGRQFSASLGVVCGVLLTLSLGTLWIAYEVRAYAFALMLFTWATAFLLAALARPTVWRTLGYAALMAAALYTHYTALAGLVAHGVISSGVALFRLRARHWRAALSAGLPIALAALIFAPWLPIMIARSGADRSFYSGQIAPDLSLRVLTGFRVLGRQDDPEVALTWIGIYVLFITVGVLSGAVLPTLRRALSAGLALSVPPIAITVLLLMINPKLTGRYFWTAWLGLDLLAAIALVVAISALSRDERVRGALGLIAALVIVSAPQLSGERGTPPKSDFRSAYAHICTQGTPEDVILLRDGTLFVAHAYYGKLPPCETPRHALGMPDALVPDVTRYLDLGTLQAKMREVAARRPPNVWIISWQADIMDPQALTFALLDAAGEHTEVRRMFGDVRLDRYTKLDFALLDKLAIEGATTQADWFNIAPVPDGATFMAARLFAPQPAHVGDTLVVQAWWRRGARTLPTLRASARLTTLDNGWLYTQVDQPPAGWKFWDDRWIDGVPAFGRYELVIGDDVPAGRHAVRYVIYDADGAWQPIVITLGEVEVVR